MKGLRPAPDPDRRSCRFYFKMFTARATTRMPMTRDTAASVIIISLAHRLIADTSVELNAVAVQNDSDR